MKQSDILIKKYFEIKSLVQTDIESFNHFIENDLNQIIEENKYIEPTIIPHNIDDFKIRLDKIWIQKPEITEADGSKRPIYPIEARLRKVSYSAPVFIKVSAHINDVQREEFETQVGNLPVMLKSSFCHLNGMSKEDLIKHGEDPDDPGGYFIINGTEKVLIDVEDLAPNRFMVSSEPTGVSKFVGKLFSSSGSFRIPHTLEKMKDSIFYLTFTRVKRIPLVVMIKALGMTNDADIMSAISRTKHYDEVMINLYEFIDIKNPEDAVDWIAKKIGITQSKEIRLERMNEIIDRYLLPHIGVETDDRLAKAQNLCKMLKKFIMVSNEEIPTDDKDHYMNKRIKLSGDMMGELFRVNLKVLIGDLLYNFQRIVKRGKFPSIKVIIRDKLLTSRIYSSMATGNWVGGRKGISQRIQRHNFLDTVSHLQRVVSPLSTSQENFEARELHPTHLGRLCPIETPEGTNIGLRKNLALLSSISNDADTEKLTRSLQEMGLKVPE